jgi:hypothetical protein
MVQHAIPFHGGYDDVPCGTAAARGSDRGHIDIGHAETFELRSGSLPDHHGPAGLDADVNRPAPRHERRLLSSRRRKGRLRLKNPAVKRRTDRRSAIDRRSASNKWRRLCDFVAQILASQTKLSFRTSFEPFSFDGGVTGETDSIAIIREPAERVVN